MFDLLEQVMPDEPTVLDLAAGPGAISQRFLRRFPEARSVAVDVDPVLLHIGRARLDQRTSQGSALRRVLADVMAARNAVAHGSETQLEALEVSGVTIDVDTVHGWQTALDELATLLDALVGEHVDTLTGRRMR